MRLGVRGCGLLFFCGFVLFCVPIGRDPASVQKAAAAPNHIITEDCNKEKPTDQDQCFHTNPSQICLTKVLPFDSSIIDAKAYV